MGNTLRISRSLLGEMVAMAAADVNEVCGLLLGSGDDTVDAIGPCANVHPSKATHFEIDPAALIAAHRTARGGGPAIVGYYHSHPSGTPVPSVTDAAAAAPDGAIWLIVAHGTARAWRAVRDGAVQGRFDPVELVVT